LKPSFLFSIFLFCYWFFVSHRAQGLSDDAVLEAVERGVAQAQRELPIIVRVIVCGLRHDPPSVSERMAQLAVKHMHKSIVVGFDLAGPENGFPASNHKNSRKKRREII
jgi:adenosine deaminase